MPSQFSSIGFTVSSGGDLAALASQVADKADRIVTAHGEYLRWAPPSGEQLWLQITSKGDAMGMNPHFAGQASMRIGVEARVARPAQTPLDGAFLAWANPPDGEAGQSRAESRSGDYPFAFDCPDAARHLELPLPAVVTAQIAAFAQQVSLYESPGAYAASPDAQAARGTRSFIPSGLISPAGEPVIPPESHALIAGHVVDASPRTNSVTGAHYWWALVDTVGGTFDVVIDPHLLLEQPRAGNVLSGWFWLSGRLLTEEPAPKPASGWLRRLIGR
jgi:hypothetical protein